MNQEDRSASNTELVQAAQNAVVAINRLTEVLSSSFAAGFVVGPASAVNGNIALFDGPTGKLIKDGGTIAAFLAILMTTEGDMIRRNAVEAERFGIGNLGEILRSDGTIPGWHPNFDIWSWTFPEAEDGVHKFILNFPYDVAIDTFTTISEAGTCDVEGLINATPLGGGPNSVSTSEDTVSHTTDNIVGAGDDFSLEISTAAACEWMTVTAAVRVLG